MNIICLFMSLWFVTVVLKNPSHSKLPYSPAEWLCLLPVLGRHCGITVLYCLSIGSQYCTACPLDHSIVLPVHWITVLYCLSTGSQYCTACPLDHSIVLPVHWITVLYCLSTGSQYCTACPLDHSIVLPVHWITLVYCLSIGSQYCSACPLDHSIVLPVHWITVLFCLSIGSQYCTACPLDHSIVLPVHWITCFPTSTGTHPTHSPSGWFTLLLVMMAVVPSKQRSTLQKHTIFHETRY
jgi:hypothetical protein